MYTYNALLALFLQNNVVPFVSSVKFLGRDGTLVWEPHVTCFSLAIGAFLPSHLCMCEGT